jgi:hypothetical protein
MFSTMMLFSREKEYVAIAEKRLEMADENPTIQGYENGVFKLRHD